MSKNEELTWDLVVRLSTRQDGCLIWGGRLNNGGNPSYHALNIPGGHVRTWVAKGVAKIPLVPREETIMLCGRKTCLEPSHMRRGHEYCRKLHPAMAQLPSGEWYCTVCARNSRVRGVYGVEPEVIAAALIEQDGKCKICTQPFGEFTYYIDHDHKDGHFRGLLCIKCNSLIGMAGDSVEVLQSAIGYLVDDAQRNDTSN